MTDVPYKGKPRYSDIRVGKLDTVAARRSLVNTAKKCARDEDEVLAAEGLHIGSSDDKVASYRGVGLGLYFKLLHWLFWMMMWMMFCSVPYLITINTSVFTDYAHRDDQNFGIKVFDRFELSSFTFAAILDDRKDNGTLQYMTTDIADTWKGPMLKSVFLTWIALVDAGATVLLTAAVALLFILVDRWLRRVDEKTREVADYTVIVGGLPPTITATEVGEYFEQHFSRDPKVDKVMDVVLVRGFSSVVKACKEVHKYEQLKRFVADMESKHTSLTEPLPPVPEAMARVSKKPSWLDIPAVQQGLGEEDNLLGAAATGAVSPVGPPIGPAAPAPTPTKAAPSPRGFKAGPVAEGSVGSEDQDGSIRGISRPDHQAGSDGGGSSDSACSGGGSGDSEAAAGGIHVGGGNNSGSGSEAGGSATSAAEMGRDVGAVHIPASRAPSGTPSRILSPSRTPSRILSPSRTPSKASNASRPSVALSTPTKSSVKGAPSTPLYATPSKKDAAMAAAAAATPTKAVSLMAVAAGGAAAQAAKDPEAGSPVALPETMSVDMSREMRKVEIKIAEQKALVERKLREGKLQSKAALVTFNTEAMKHEVCKRLPSGWWGGLLMSRALRLEHGGRKWRVWVRKAAAPDDYRFENLETSIRSNIFIQVVTGVVMFAFIVVCAAFITWLSATSSKEDRAPVWESGEMLAAIRIGMAKLTSSSGTGPVNGSAYDGFCGSVMPACAAYTNSRFPDADVNITFGSEWQFPNATSRLLNERPLRKDLQQCAQSVSCPASYCLPCYCLGLSQVPTDDASSDFLAHVKDACSDYWAPFDLQRDGIKVAISFVIALINALLGYLLRLLKYYVEKHWTTTDTELSFAVWSYLVKLINSVAVLLVVNCSTLRNLQERALANEARWLQRLILDGLYDDFTPDWYNSVGFSVQILMMINVAAPLIHTVVEWAVRAALRAQLLCLHCGRLAAPEEYNFAFRSQQFTLEARISDVLFNVTLALLFGSGMPLCYLIAAVYLLVAFWWDRLQLLTLGQPAQRYQKTLPRFIMQMLPVLLTLHCAFGLWQHTYFRAEVEQMDLVGAAAAAKPGIHTLSENSIGRRITQPNGLPLLIWFVVLCVWLVFGRWILWAVVKCLGASCAKLSACIKPEGGDSGDGTSDVTYQEALSTVKIARMLRGARTYRIHHLTNYKPFLTKGEAGRLWASAQGEQRFTRLTTFRVYVEVEVEEGRRRRTEQREVEMFDVSDAAITSTTYSNAALPIPGPFTAPGAASAACGLGNGSTGSQSLTTATPFSSATAAAAAATAGAAAVCSHGAGSTAAAAAPLTSARLSLQPSTSLQAAALQHIATLEANTGVTVKRASLRAMPYPTPTLVYGNAAVEPLAFELDLNRLSTKPVLAAALAASAAAAAATASATVPASTVRTGAALAALVGVGALPSAGTTSSHLPSAMACVALPAAASSKHTTPVKDATGAGLTTTTASVPVFKLVLDRSPSAASSHRTITSSKSAPAGPSGATVLPAVSSLAAAAQVGTTTAAAGAKAAKTAGSLAAESVTSLATGDGREEDSSTTLGSVGTETTVASEASNRKAKATAPAGGAASAEDAAAGSGKAGSGKPKAQAAAAAGGIPPAKVSSVLLRGGKSMLPEAPGTGAKGLKGGKSSLSSSSSAGSESGAAAVGSGSGSVTGTGKGGVAIWIPVSRASSKNGGSNVP